MAERWSDEMEVIHWYERVTPGRFEGDAGKPTVLYIDSPRPDDELQAFRRALSEVARG